MKSRHIRQLTLSLLVCLAPIHLWAEEAAAYRVDVIVFSHLGGASDQRHSPEVSDFGEYLDPLANARAAAWMPPIEPEEISISEQARLDALETIDQLRALENPDQRPAGEFRGGPVFPTPWLGLDGMSSIMVRAWQRLEASERHQPLVWRSWHQALESGERGRWIRLRGGRLLGLDWLNQEVADPQYLAPFESGPYPFLLPRTRHQLDGVIRLRQRQFMHVDLDLIWQTPIEATPSPLAADWYRPGGVDRHPLEQSRSIRTDRVEYFDSSLLGILVRVEESEGPRPGERREAEAP